MQIHPTVLQFITRRPTHQHARLISATLPRESFAVSRGESITVSCSAGTGTCALGRWSTLDLSNRAALFEPLRKEVTGDWRKLHKESLHDSGLTSVIIVTWCEGQQKSTLNFGGETSQRDAAVIN